MILEKLAVFFEGGDNEITGNRNSGYHCQNPYTKKLVRAVLERTDLETDFIKVQETMSDPVSLTLAVPKTMCVRLRTTSRGLLRWRNMQMRL